MNKILKKLVQSEQGNVVALVALSMTLMLIFASLVLDVGRVYMAKSHLQTSANSAALSGAQSLPDRMTEAQQIAEQMIDTNDPDSQEVTVQVESKMVTVTAERDVQLYLGRFAGVDNITVGVIAKAKLNPIIKGDGAAPIGVNEQWYSTLNKNQLYELKIDHPDIGNTGILRLGAPGKENYYDNLLYGYPGTVEVQMIVPTETGTVTGKTRDAINYRMTQCPSPPNTYENYDRDCERILLVPTYVPIYDQGSVKEVKITGFAYFYVEDVESNGKAIVGRFINYAGGRAVYGSDLQTDYGAYAIRLVR